MGMGHPTFINEEEYKMVMRHRQVKQHEEYKYLHLLQDILDNGTDSDDRTGVGTRKIFATQLKFDLTESFPILTTKRVYWKGVVEELLWFMRGETDANKLKEKGVHIWDGNTTREFLDNKGLDYPEGYIGPGYGWQWRNWGGEYQNMMLAFGKSRGVPSGGEMSETLGDQGIDQLKDALYKIKNKPDDRRILVSAWNPSQLDEMALPPCHLLFQFQVENGKLHLQWYQRSVDSFLGLPFNISSYALLTCLFAKCADLEPGTVTFVGGDTHIYKNHFEQVDTQCLREPFPFPKLIIPDVKTIEDIENLTFEDIKLDGYQAHKTIKAEMAV